MDESASMLIVASLTCSVAIALVLKLRKPMRRCGDAQVAYAIWSLVPLATLASLVPTPPMIVVRQLAPVLSTSAEAISSSPFSMMAPTNGNFDTTACLLGVWLAGIAVSITLFLTRHRRFVRDRKSVV